MLYKEKFLIKQVEDHDLPAVKELMLKVFNKRVSMTYLKNKYNTSYLSIRYICSIAYADKIPVAFYGAIPQKFCKGENEYFVAHACDSFTLKKHQGQGLHYQLAKFSYEIMKQNNIKFVYAFHSENTYYSTKKLGWKEYLNLERFHIKVATLPIAKVLNKLHLNGFYKFFFKKTTIKSVIEKLDELHKDNYRQKFDLPFIAYKNTFKNHYFIEIENCIFWVKVEAILLIGLFYAPSEQDFQKAIKKLKRKAFWFGITELLFQVHPHSKMSDYLKTITKPKTSWLVGYLDFDPTVNIEDFRFSYYNLDTF